MKKIILDGHEIEISDESFEAFKRQFTKEPKDRVKMYGIYYYITLCGAVSSSPDYCDETDNYLYAIGNYYLTKEEAKRALEIQNILSKYKYKFSKEELEDIHTDKWYIYIDTQDKLLKTVRSVICLPSNILFKNKEFAQKAINEIGYADYVHFMSKKA